jgi:membrane associated rhomboid family serine protease
MVLAPTQQTLRKFGACNYQLLKDGEVWRLIAAAFLHFDLLQILMSTISILFFVTQL